MKIFLTLASLLAASTAQPWMKAGGIFFIIILDVLNGNYCQIVFKNIHPWMKGEPDVVCPEAVDVDGLAVFVPHPTDCGLYYQCVGLQPVLMSCPPGLYWDPSLNVCNWPDNVDCNPETDPAPETTTEEEVEATQ